MGKRMSEAAWARALPFGVFMAFLGLEEGLRFGNGTGWWRLSERFFLLAYPVKIAAVVAALLFFRHCYRELDLHDGKNLKYLLASLALGLAVFGLWIRMEWGSLALTPGVTPDPALLGSEAARVAWIAVRLFGAVLVVPVMEELFWRSFIIRYLIHADFETVPIGAFTWFSCLATIVLFGLEHNLIAAGMMAGAAYNLLLYRTRSLFRCVVAHAVTNLALGIYVLKTGQWQFW
ncbi:MAG: CAAX prenyl protease-related protein [Deltaproteobacteria bacterium]|nr:CAAX prenyl protease-related protein [Deltaproteobacteria bacterium]